MKYRRINIYAGAGAGKSSTATWLFAKLKIANYSIELVPEWVKKWAYEGRPISSFDECYAFAKQMHKEDSYLRHGADLIISDSPILMIGAYSLRNNEPFTEELISLSGKFNAIYPSIDIFLDRGDIPYKKEGRYENYEQAMATDKIIKDVLMKHSTCLKLFKTKESNKILNFIIEKLTPATSMEILHSSGCSDGINHEFTDSSPI